MLYLVATPIGNLKDITYRAVEVLKSCDRILCEDTRHSLSLLKHYDIHKPLESFHKFCEASKENEIIEELKSGKILGLISDAGTPGIADPGTRLVQQCIAAGITVESIPGPCAAVQALSCSGLNTSRFQFIGFLPKKQGELKKLLQEILCYPGTTICYESPNRLLSVLECLHECAPQRSLVVARELTKKFEEIQRGTAQELLAYWKENILKGEIVILIGEDLSTSSIEWMALSPEEHVELMQNTYSLSRRDAIKLVAELRGVPKRDIYNKFNETNN